jgi:hypothetical protein
MINDCDHGSDLEGKSLHVHDPFKPINTSDLTTPKQLTMGSWHTLHIVFCTPTALG